MIKWLLLFLSLNTYATTLVLIGGGHRPESALKHFVSQTKTGPIYVLPWGTEAPIASFEAIKMELNSLGILNIECFCDDAWTSQDLAKILNAGGIYFPGGDQNKIMDRLQKNQLIPVIQNLFKNNIPVAGTSAGTAIQTNPMLTGNDSDTTLGLGLLPNFIVDQHFIVRQREARLLLALEAFPLFNGIGVDENMSVVVTDSKQFKALGPSEVRLYIRRGIILETHSLRDHEIIEIPRLK